MIIFSCVYEKNKINVFNPLMSDKQAYYTIILTVIATKKGLCNQYSFYESKNFYNKQNTAVFFYVINFSSLIIVPCVAHLYCINSIGQNAVLRILIGVPVTLLTIVQGVPPIHRRYCTNAKHQ